jgi:hypothetical protein
MNSISRAFLKLLACALLGGAALLVVDVQPAAACASCITCTPYQPHKTTCMPSTPNDPNHGPPYHTKCDWDCVTSDGGQTYHPANINCYPAQCTDSCYC